MRVEDHHFFFSGPDVEQAIPYGIHDIARNTGWVNVGVDHDTSTFAVESIRRWWKARSWPGEAGTCKARAPGAIRCGGP